MTIAELTSLLGEREPGLPVQVTRALWSGPITGAAYIVTVTEADGVVRIIVRDKDEPPPEFARERR